MKNTTICLSLILLSASLKLSAQTPEKAVAIASYHLVHIRDTTQRNKPYAEDFHLLLAAGSSAFSSWDDAQFQEAMAKSLKEQVAAAPDPNHLNLTITGERPVTAEMYFQFLSTSKIVTVHKLINDYMTDEPLAAIGWKISSDTATISGYLCQKATAHFKGRDYTAWFCSQLPFHSGPWKLNGLPGLILQAEDSKKEVIFQLRGFQTLNSGVMVELPKDATTITQKEYDRLVTLKKNDPSAFYAMPSNQHRDSSPMGDIDASKIASINVNRAPGDFSKVVNNPIELPGK